MPAQLSPCRVKQKRFRQRGRASRLRYPGQRYDAASGLNYNYMRDGYDAATGRYSQSDPVGHLGGINTYAYANNSPLTWFDVDGLQAKPNPQLPPSPPSTPRYPNLPPANDPSYGPNRSPGGAVGSWARWCLNPYVAGVVLMALPSNIGQPWRNCSDDPRKERPECRDEEDERCREVRDQCIRGCSDFVLQKPRSKRPDLGGMDFHRCVRQCLDRNDCP